MQIGSIQPERMACAVLIAGLLALGAGVGSAATAPSEVDEDRFADLIVGFPQPTGVQRALLLSVRESPGLLGGLGDFFAPRVFDRDRISEDLGEAIAEHYDLLPPIQLNSYLSPLADSLSRFESDASLDAQAVADLNLGLDTNYLFVASLRPAVDSECGVGSYLRVELRRFSGASASDVRILANTACVPGSLQSDGMWNHRAALVYGALLLSGMVSLLRGFGSLEVKANLPAGARGSFAVALAREHRGKPVRSERKLEAGRSVRFGLLRARKAPYYVSIKGALLHPKTGDVIEDFSEEKSAIVGRGGAQALVFDLRPRQAAVQVSICEAGRPATRAQIAVRGARTPIRHATQGVCTLNLDKGSHTLLVGSGDRVAEAFVRVDGLDAPSVTVNLDDGSGLVFQGCEAAVAPYLEERVEDAARILESSGHAAAAQRIRGGDPTSPESPVAATGETTNLEMTNFESRAIPLSGSSDSDEATAESLEASGSFTAAAELWKALGEHGRAAAAYEQGGDLRCAIACYHQIGDVEKTVLLLEQTGRYYEAGKVAYEDGQIDRALHALRRIDETHRRYPEASAMLGAIFFRKDDSQAGVGRLDEVLRSSRPELLPPEHLERYGECLEKLGRVDDALLVLGMIREHDPRDQALGTRIEALEQQREERKAARDAESETQLRPTAAGPGAASAEPARESRYEIIEELGRGAMGVVYKARDTYLGRTVALKHLIDNLREHPNAVAFFEREARSAAVLNHPNIVTVYDAGQENGTYFISMEFLEGTPFDALVKSRGPLEPAIAMSLGLQVVAGLQYAHKNKIIHRDIKTANLFLTQDKVVKIMDFGLAKMVEEVRRSATIIGGTPYYMPPEQTLGQAVDHRADLYALGVTLFQLVSAGYPFSKGDVAYHHCHTPAPDVREFIATVPAELAELIRDLMEKNPDDRVQSAGEVGVRLQSILDSLRAGGDQGS